MTNRLLAAALAALVLPAAAQADYKNYSKILVFGDSLVDAGNAHYGALAGGITDPTPAAAGYVANRFTNGVDATHYGTFADYLGKQITGSVTTAYLPTTNGNNYAVGGADAVYKSGEVSPSFLPQLSLFQAKHQPITADTLVLVTFGGNDIRDELLNTDPVDFTPTVNALFAGLYGLVQGGAISIVVTGLPDISTLPDTIAKANTTSDPAGIIALAKARSIALNAAFAQAVAGLDALTGAHAQFFDLLSYENNLVADPGAYGLPTLDTQDTCQSGGIGAVAVQHCAGYLYFDKIHPTTQVHETIANAIGAELLGAVPEPASWAMMIAGFGAIGAALRRGRRSTTVRFG